MKFYEGGAYRDDKTYLSPTSYSLSTGKHSEQPDEKLSRFLIVPISWLENSFAMGQRRLHLLNRFCALSSLCNRFPSILLTDPPIVSLNLGSTLSPEDIKEGDDVYFECHIRANPPWSKLTWVHDVSAFSFVTRLDTNQR